MVKIGVVGFGYWGPNIVRNFNNVDGATVACVADSREDRLNVVRKLYPDAETVTSADDLFNNEDIDAVVIATPVFTHHPLARKALEKGKHVLVEKPMTSSTGDAQDLIKLADEVGKVLMVDHTFLYTGAVRYIKQAIDNGDLGDIHYIDSTRINLGLFQKDINVLWDLAPHDISICSYLLGKRPQTVQAVGASHTNTQIENIAYLTLKYENELIAHFNCSWVSPVKIRQILIGGDSKMVLFNDTEPTEKVKIYDAGYKATTDEEQSMIRVDYRTGDIYVPKIQNTEALSLMANDFVDAITKGSTPVSDAAQGLAVVEILDAAQQSIKQGGKEIAL